MSCPMEIVAFWDGINQPKTMAAITAPKTCDSKNAGASNGRMPENVSVAARAIVAAGLAKEVEAVNQ